MYCHKLLNMPNKMVKLLWLWYRMNRLLKKQLDELDVAEDDQLGMLADPLVGLVVVKMDYWESPRYLVEMLLVLKFFVMDLNWLNHMLSKFGNII